MADPIELTPFHLPTLARKIAAALWTANIDGLIDPDLLEDLEAIDPRLAAEMKRSREEDDYSHFEAASDMCDARREAASQDHGVH